MIYLVLNGLVQQYTGKKEEKNLRAYLYREHDTGLWMDMPEFGWYAKTMWTYGQAIQLLWDLVENIKENPVFYIWAFAGGLIVLGVVFFWLIFTGDTPKTQKEEEKIEEATDKKPPLNGNQSKEKTE